MKNYLIVSIMFLISLLTVSTLANADTERLEQANANLVIYRPNDGSALSYRFWVDGEYMGTLELDEVVKLQLSPGEHVITANDRNRTRLVVTVAEHGSTFVRSEIYRKVRMSLKVEAPDSRLDGVVAGL